MDHHESFPSRHSVSLFRVGRFNVHKPTDFINMEYLAVGRKSLDGEDAAPRVVE